MKRVEELEYPTRDRTKNYILQLMDQGFEKWIEKGVVNLLKKGSSIEFICDFMEVSPEYVAMIQESMDR